MVIVASIYLRFYIEVGVGTFLLTPTPPKIPSDSESTALQDKTPNLATTASSYNPSRLTLECCSYQSTSGHMNC
jgi:hypothetical protein